MKGKNNPRLELRQVFVYLRGLTPSTGRFRGVFECKNVLSKKNAQAGFGDVEGRDDVEFLVGVIKSAGKSG
jgi:hypothetical protein